MALPPSTGMGTGNVSKNVHNPLLSHGTLIVSSVCALKTIKRLWVESLRDWNAPWGYFRERPYR